jgi:hypothetical protein
VPGLISPRQAVGPTLMEGRAVHTQRAAFLFRANGFRFLFSCTAICTKLLSQF